MQNAELEPRFQGSAQQLFTVGVAVVWSGGSSLCTTPSTDCNLPCAGLSSEDQHTCAVNENVLAFNNIMK